MTTIDNPTKWHLRDNWAPVLDERTDFDLRVDGVIPEQLQGLYVRTGPNPASGTSKHWFFGDGMVHGIRLQEGRADWYRNRYVGSKRLSEARQLASDLAAREVDLRKFYLAVEQSPISIAMVDAEQRLDYVNAAYEQMGGYRREALLGQRPQALGIDSTLALTGWEDKRRVVVLRRPLQGQMLVAQEDNGQQLLGFIEADRKGGKRITGYEYAVLVTNLDYEILSLGQLYRDRADAENAFDELKNQWGWGGFTTHDLHRCQLSARAVALIYNWWSLFVRLANPEARLEAITSRPWLMSSVGRRTEHAGQTTITLDRGACELEAVVSRDTAQGLRVNYTDPRLHERLMTVLKERAGHHVAHEVEQAKIRCSQSDGATQVDLSCVEPDLLAALDTADMREHLGALLARTVACARACVQRAGLTDASLDAIYLTGGSSALRPFQRALQAEFPSVPLVEGDLFGGVASGLAYTRV